MLLVVTIIHVNLDVGNPCYVIGYHVINNLCCNHLV